MVLIGALHEQAMADLHEQYVDLVSASIKTVLDPKKHSPGAAAGGEMVTNPGGARPSHGGATAKLQVSLPALHCIVTVVMYWQRACMDSNTQCCNPCLA